MRQLRIKTLEPKVELIQEIKATDRLSFLFSQRPKPKRERIDVILNGKIVFASLLEDVDKIILFPE